LNHLIRPVFILSPPVLWPLLFGKYENEVAFTNQIKSIACLALEERGVIRSCQLHFQFAVLLLECRDVVLDGLVVPVECPQVEETTVNDEIQDHQA
jgi:hypothetical protein